MGAGNRESHLWLHLRFDPGQQEPGHPFKKETLANDKYQRNHRVKLAVDLIKVVKPVAEQIQNEIEISHDQQGINEKLDQERLE
jgi:hypothetical protein